MVEVASLEIEKFDKFARLIQEKALKKPVFIQDKVKSIAVQKSPRFEVEDDQDWSLELETKKQRAMVVQEMVRDLPSYSRLGFGFGSQEKEAMLDVNQESDCGSKPTTHPASRVQGCDQYIEWA